MFSFLWKTNYNTTCFTGIDPGKYLKHDLFVEKWAFMIILKKSLKNFTRLPKVFIGTFYNYLFILRKMKINYSMGLTCYCCWNKILRVEKRVSEISNIL